MRKKSKDHIEKNIKEDKSSAQDDNLRLLEEYKDLLQRKQAEFENYRKRIDKDRQEYIKYATTELIASLLPVLDNFKVALDSCHDGMDARSILDGVKMIYSQLEKTLQECGVKKIESVGTAFDPACHEIFECVQDPDKKDGTIIEQVRYGYKLHDRLLRPAMVKVIQNVKRKD